MCCSMSIGTYPGCRSCVDSMQVSLSLCPAALPLLPPCGHSCALASALTRLKPCRASRLEAGSQRRALGAGSRRGCPRCPLSRPSLPLAAQPQQHHRCPRGPSSQQRSEPAQRPTDKRRCGGVLRRSNRGGTGAPAAGRLACTRRCDQHPAPLPSAAQPRQQRQCPTWMQAGPPLHCEASSPRRAVVLLACTRCSIPRSTPHSGRRPIHPPPIAAGLCSQPLCSSSSHSKHPPPQQKGEALVLGSH